MTLPQTLAQFAGRSNIKPQNLFSLFWTAMTLSSDEVGDPIEGLGARLNRFKWNVKQVLFMFLGGYYGELELYRVEVIDHVDEYGNDLGTEISYQLVEDVKQADVVTLTFFNAKKARVMFDKLDGDTAQEALRLGYR
ncbi:hypothetical protein PsAD2_01456 [Pseudovibrio axinellae]|uniref:Uncharacterized protein n=1 Tax=Pseudovibrio axinellae TaxID=989403 RepID=A0A165ZYW1_9HYPH|nr:hypothetical protein [Pseudovibrio axinellae]KZL20413.1 hypothetical protein PsAD2_01456 [Pseudovibrio axinellae]SER77740.1 hypothetical protein SAMN05421798_12224 [Pseudovibrio axinellae]